MFYIILILLYIWCGYLFVYRFNIIDIIKVPGATGDYHTDFNAKGEQFFKTITDKGLFFLINNN